MLVLAGGHLSVGEKVVDLFREEVQDLVDSVQAGEPTQFGYWDVDLSQDGSDPGLELEDHLLQLQPHQALVVVIHVLALRGSTLGNLLDQASASRGWSLVLYRARSTSSCIDRVSKSRDIFGLAKSSILSFFGSSRREEVIKEWLRRLLAGLARALVLEGRIVMGVLLLEREREWC